MEQFFGYLPGILLAYTAVLLALMSPGPNVMAVIGTSMSIGRRRRSPWRSVSRSVPSCGCR